jgi:hypothetical protein
VSDIALTPSFQKSLARLTRQEQNLVHQTVMQFWMRRDTGCIRSKCATAGSIRSAQTWICASSSFAMGIGTS